ncbi:general stress protein [Microbacterium sp. NPDC089698]|uniref:general stress protein n=1 Tax=Microbacterium sp. NPDC089698 TaxID=3364200 RepID=UPI00382EF412
MSMLNTSGPAGEIGETVATVTEYEAAQKLVSQLIAGEIPARAIAIVGVGVQTVERVTGRLGYANAARSGAVNGVLIGLFLSAIFVLGNPSVPMQAFIGILFVGVAIGMILSLITYSIVRRRRDYASVMQLKADHYEVTVLPDSVGKARQVLGRAVTPIPQPGPAAGAATGPAVGSAAGPAAAPPQYGERIEEPPRYGERIAPQRPPMPPAPPVASAPPVEGASVEGAPASGEPAAGEPAEGANPAEGENPAGDGAAR